MAKIKLMDKNLRELIAAGEVVERPASVVKELLENAIDAGSNTITVEIANGGRTLIRVTDNGCGINREDVELAFVSHATSKLKNREDLDSIETLGFRGEALSSISTVSKVTLLTKTADEDFGTSVLVEGGEIIEISEAGAPDGTTIVVNDLFFNTPARMKFLKSDMGESNAVAGIVDKLAISHPEISFKFIRDNRIVYKTSGDKNLKSAVSSVYGRELAESLIEVNYEYNGIKITGLTSKPANSRKSRNMQNFFLNGRYIKTKTGYAALDEAYKNSIMVGKHPSCFLNISIPANKVDVNVHPAKIEVRFENESLIFDAVRFAVKTALSAGDTRPQMRLNKNEGFKNILRENEGNPVQRKMAQAIYKALDTSSNVEKQNQVTYQKSADVTVSLKENYFQRDNAVSSLKNEYKEQNSEQKFINNAFSENSAKEKEQETVATVKPDFEEKYKVKENRLEENIQTKEVTEKNIKFIGEAFDTYIIAEYGRDILFIDKHAAHERLIYERLKGGDIDKSGRQFFIEPLSINLPKNEYNAVIENLSLLDDAGFEVDDFGDGTILLRSVPSMLMKEDATATVEEIADRLLINKREVTTNKLDWIYHSISCRSAIKGGNKSTPEELIKIATQALNQDVMYCPHGRPIAIVLKKSEIEKQFGRI